MQIDVQVDVERGQLKLAEAGRRLNPRVLLSLIAMRLVSLVTHQFETRGEGKWAPLRPSTLLFRTRGGDAPLQDSGRYRQAWTGQVSPNPISPAPETDERTYVEIGTSDFRAKWFESGTAPYTIRATKKVLAGMARGGQWHFFGKVVHHPGLPARPVLPTKSVVEGVIQEELKSYLEVELA